MKPISKKKIIIIAFLLVFFIRSVQEYKFQSDMYQFRLEMSEQQVKSKRAISVKRSVNIRILI